MNADYRSVEGLISAMFSYEFLDNGIDYDSIERIHRGDVDEWVTALDRSGLFDYPVIDEVKGHWHRQPKILLDTLLAEADEMTIRRCTTTWAALDRLAPLTSLGQIG